MDDRTLPKITDLEPSGYTGEWWDIVGDTLALTMMFYVVLKYVLHLI